MLPLPNERRLPLKAVLDNGWGVPQKLLLDQSQSSLIPEGKFDYYELVVPRPRYEDEPWEPIVLTLTPKNGGQQVQFSLLGDGVNTRGGVVFIVLTRFALCACVAHRYIIRSYGGIEDAVVTSRLLTRSLLLVVVYQWTAICRLVVANVVVVLNWCECPPFLVARRKGLTLNFYF